MSWQLWPTACASIEQCRLVCMALGAAGQSLSSTILGSGSAFTNPRYSAALLQAVDITEESF